MGKCGVVKALIHVIEEPATQQRVLQKCWSAASLDFQGIFTNDDAFEIELGQPLTALFGRWSLSDIGFKPSSFLTQAPCCHFLIHPVPKGIERAQRRKRQDHLSSRFEVC